MLTGAEVGAGGKVKGSAAQAGSAGLMLSLPTVMCCYATQAEKALPRLHAWLHDMRRGRLGEREEYERREYRGGERLRAEVEF